MGGREVRSSSSASAAPPPRTSPVMVPMRSMCVMQSVCRRSECGRSGSCGTMRHMATEYAAIDRIDEQILSILRDDGRIGWSELGARVHLSPNAAAERVRRLVRSGVIRRFAAEIDPAALGRTLEAVIDV